MTHPSPLPSLRDHHLDEAVATLAGRGDNIGVVRVVEAWGTQGTPTRRAQLAEARAFLRLRLMDRALNRTREVLEAEPEHAEALLLQAEIYLERGWPLKARKPLQQLREQLHGGGRDTGVSAEVETFWARAQADPIRPEATAREVEREGSPAKLLALAESFLATGSFLRATGILERLRRAEPDNARVKELLWSLAGDYGAGGQSVDALVAMLLPPSATARELPLDEPEHTESFDLRAVDLDPETAESTNFPALFKYAPHAAEAGAEDPQEATQASGLASRAEMGANAGGNTDPGRQLLDMLPTSDPSDTQIMLVLRPGEERPNQVHRRKEDGPDSLRETLNLRAWQEAMGVPGASDLADTPDDLLEEEDENVVVMTRGGGPAPEPLREASATFGKPIEVVEKHAVPQVPPRSEWTIGADAPAPLEDVPPTPPPRTFPRVLLAGAVLAGAVALLVAVVAVGSLGARSSASSVREDLVRALAAEDYNALLTQEGRLEQRVANGERASEVSEVRAALAETQLVLWSDYNGDPTRIGKVREGLDKSSQLEVHRLAVLRAAEALARQDVAGASAALGRERPGDDEERFLFARIAARGGDLERALEHFDAIEAAAQPRYRLGRAEVLADAGRSDEARALVQEVLKGAPDHAAARTLSFELDEAPPAEVITAVDLFLQSPAGSALPPRLEGRLQALRARAFLALGATGNAQDAIERGLSRDGANPDLLFLRAADLARAQKLAPALRELDSVVGARPGAAEAQAAYVLLLLELDRVDEAEEAVLRLEAAAMLPNLTPVLETLVSVWGNQEPPGVVLLPPQQATPLGAYAAALLAVQERSADALAILQVAIAATRGSADPFERRLAPRLIAMQALVAGPPEGDPYVTEALALDAEDPAVHVFAGRYFEKADRKALAAQHFDRAAQLGPELGLAWYEKGRFYLDARDGFSRSGAAWRNFLALAPSGPRAVRAKDTLGVR